MTEEIWKPIVEFPDYEVSSLGRVRRVVPGKRGHGCCVIKPRLGNHRYYIVGLTLNGKQKTRTIHQLVCRAFHGEPPTPLHLVAHGDGTRDNNSADNLRWATSAENAADSLKHGVFAVGDSHWSHRKPEKVLRGENHNCAKLTASDIREIRSAVGPQHILAAKFGVGQSAISMIRNRKKWAHIA